MQSSAQANYLTTEVMTATPQKLQLMMIEGAIRSAEQARANWTAGDDEGACESLIRAQEIVGELMAALNHEIAPELTGKVASVYMFVFRSLVEANYQHDEKRLDDAVRILEEERQTWRQVCETIGSQSSTDDPPAPGLPVGAIAPALPAETGAIADVGGESGLSLEA
ncbi:MAG: flagellar export chaperone FliS [Candidatus Nealsonbacteria bacterium]|nr:flagellar export chaperone FliS [Candidatus Nealsonbacteria bacterium]